MKCRPAGYVIGAAVSGNEDTRHIYRILNSDRACPNMDMERNHSLAADSGASQLQSPPQLSKGQKSGFQIYMILLSAVRMVIDSSYTFMPASFSTQGYPFQVRICKSTRPIYPSFILL